MARYGNFHPKQEKIRLKRLFKQIKDLNDWVRLPWE
jgi:hypothetical protein